MDEVEQHRANIEDEAPSVERRPGPPKGVPKPPGSGRKKGTPNRVTRDIKQLALRDAPAMLRGLKKLAETATDEKTKLAAIVAYLDRAVGKPVSPSEISGPDGSPIQSEAQVTTLEAAQRIANLMSSATDHATEANVRDTARRVAFTLNAGDRAMGIKPDVLAVSPNAMPPVPVEPKSAPQPYQGPTPEEQAQIDADEQLMRHRQSIEGKCSGRSRTVVQLRNPR